MPHVIVKMWPGPSEQQKRRLAEQMVETPLPCSSPATSPCRLTSRKWN